MKLFLGLLEENKGRLLKEQFLHLLNHPCASKLQECSLNLEFIVIILFLLENIFPQKAIVGKFLITEARMQNQILFQWGFLSRTQGNYFVNLFY